MSDPSDILSLLLSLSHRLGLESRELAILGEGNTSARVDAETFFVKASGGNLATLAAERVVRCRFDALLPMLDRASIPEQEIEDLLFASRVDAQAKKPSVEALFHAYLLTLPGVNFVAHTHPTAVNQILCSPQAAAFATGRLFPDEVVCCGTHSVLLGYTDPGLVLAQSIRAGVEQFRQDHGVLPRVILLGNHGAITLGAAAEAAEAAMLMLVKAAHIFRGATALGGPIFMSAADVSRIAHRLDEHHRQRELKL